jgi:hypothetical protein
MRVAGPNGSPLMVFHSVSVILDGASNTKQIVTTPVTASSISIINNSRYETVRVVIVPTIIIGGNMNVKLSPGEDIQISFGQRIIKEVQIEAVEKPISTIEDSLLVKKVGPLTNSSSYKHELSVKFLGEKIDEITKNCI